MPLTKSQLWLCLALLMSMEQLTLSPGMIKANSWEEQWAQEAQGAQSPPWALVPSLAAHQHSYEMIHGGHWVGGGFTLDSTLPKQGWMSGPQRGEAHGIYSPAAELTGQNIDDTISNKA